MVCSVRNLTLLTIAMAVATAWAPAANAAPENTAIPHFTAAFGAPVPLQPSSSCDSNYSGACVPIASDVDCAGGSGNGPAYVSGPVTVVGNDIYDLDRDGNGTGCE